MDGVLENGYAPAAKPFNVLNPSGASADASIATIGQVGEGNRNREAQAAISAQAQAGESQRSAARLKMEQSRLDNEKYYHERSEQLAQSQMQLKLSLDQIQQEHDDAIAEGNDEKVRNILEKKDEIRRQFSELSQKGVGLGLLKSALDGAFNMDMTDKDGKSIAAGVLRGIATKANGHRQVLSSAQRSLDPLIVDLMNQEGAQPTPIADAVGSALKTGLVAAVSRVLPGMTDPVARSLTASTGDTKSLGAQKWDAIARQLRNSAAGTANPEEMDKKVVSLLTNLERAATAPAGTDSTGFLKNVRDDYSALRAAGANTEILDKLFYSMHWKATSAKSSTQASIGQAEVDRASAQMAPEGTPSGPGANVLDPTSAATQATRGLGTLGRMMNLLATSTGEDGKPLLQSWGDDDFYHLKEGKDNPGIEKTILSVVGALAGAKNPEELLRKLSNPKTEPFDPADPAMSDAIKFMSTMHPEAKQVLVNEIGRTYLQLQGIRSREHVTGDVSELPVLEAQKRGLAEEADVSALDEILKSSGRNQKTRSKRNKAQEEAVARYTQDTARK